KRSASIPISSACDRTYESAMRADSFITSPSCPVSVSSLPPSIDVASTNSTSPPVPVTASPVATPGTAVRSATSWNTFWRPRASRDRGLLVDGVAVEADDLHPVEQRSGNRVGHVPGRDEEHVGQVELDVEVVIAERVVLRRIEHLEQCGRGIAAPVGADLVDLV